MTQEEKQVLLADICTRLPYGVEVLSDIDKKFDGGWISKLYNIGKHKGEWLFHLEATITPFTIEEIRPYLRPMSSMTEEEKEECCSIFNNSMYKFEVDKYGDVESTEPTVEKECLYYDAELMAEWLTWLNAHHFDYRGLIPMCLALEAPEGMYDTKTE